MFLIYDCDGNYNFKFKYIYINVFNFEEKFNLLKYYGKRKN